jgi:hypothetical protein
MSSNSKNKDYPKAYNSLADEAKGGNRPEIFEPALKQYLRAFRLGEPRFNTPETIERWNNARMQVIEYLLDVINRSEWGENLVLRGSLLLRAWLGKAARNPGDIDYVVTPSSIELGDPFSRNFFDGLLYVVSQRPQLEDAVIQVDKITVDDIWTYERAPGKRVVFPWRAADLPLGAVQMDFVFGEELFTEPELIEIPTTRGHSVLARGVSKELSLAWKLLWLETDAYPQGKDLYDAALLAEQTYLPLSLLTKVIRTSGWTSKTDFAPDSPIHWEVDWDNFQAEYPWIKGTREGWQLRLTQALSLTFAIAD